MKIRDWPAAERPREKLIADGPGRLSDGELLAVLLGSGRRGLTAVDLARGLIRDFGSLRELLCADPRECLAKEGIGPARYATLQAALEIARRHFLHIMRTGPALNTPKDLCAFLHTQLRDKPYELFCVLYVDVHNRLIKFEELFRGTVNESGVHPREVAREALRQNAFGVILAHNHPSGLPEPSLADMEVTRLLQKALALLDVQVLDHIIVGDRRCVSFKDRGLL
jgi:DNA repair protein RadC